MKMCDLAAISVVPDLPFSTAQVGTLCSKQIWASAEILFRQEQAVQQAWVKPEIISWIPNLYALIYDPV